ncbi:hypothetical protein [Gottfriedia acidiceleris]|uniref:hypothetical protein n=1 Tax=Gottfriedia acidiceleris TaxID=371036 RepID=UPI00101C0B3A|nr:hypothetical protein [Gottfriedia acidiceleris]
MKIRQCSFMIVLFISIFLAGCSKSVITDGRTNVTKEMDQIISDYIIEQYKGLYPPSEKQFEVHNVYGTEKKNDNLIVYFYSLFGTYNLSTKTESQAGHSFPALIKLKRQGYSYSVVEYEEPDEGDPGVSLKRMFPRKYEKQVRNNQGDLEKLDLQMKKKVKQWLAENK